IGRLSALAFHPTDSLKMWAGAPSGGVWKSDDNGETWSPLTDELPNIGVSDIVVNPHYPDSMYISTGDGSSGDTYSFGVLLSADGGVSWDTTGLSFGVNQQRNIRRLLIDSTNTNVLLAASTHGIFRTENAGVSWDLVQGGNFADMEFKPFANDTVYATTNSSSLQPFYVSYDNGLSWASSTSGMATGDMRRTKVAVSPAEPNVVYTLSSSSNGASFHGIYRSDNSGETWTQMATTPNILNGDEFGDGDGGQGWYSMELAVSPVNADELKVGGVNLWQSVNGGANFMLEGHWTGANGTYVHADHHRLEYNPLTNQFYVGCDGGLYRRSYFFNGFETISNGMAITQFYRLAVAQSEEGIVLGGAQDNGTFRWKENIWQGVYGGDGMEQMIDPTDPTIMYCTIQRGELHKSTDGGNNFGDDIAPIEGAWVTPFMMEPGEPEVLYAASNTKVYRSDAGGGDWFEFSPGLVSVNSGQLIMLDVAHSNTEYVVAGSRRTLRITTDLGGEWSNILSGLPSNNMTYVAFDPLEENTVWVTFSGYSEGNKVYRSEDAGETWENMSMNLPNLPVNCVEIERSSTGGVYVGTDVGVYYWDKNLSEWEPYMTGLPNVIVNELEIHEATNMLRAATYGRGIWESETRNFINVGVDENVLTNESQISIWPNPASDYVQVNFPSTKTAQNINVLDAYGRIVLTNLNTGLKKDITIGIQDLANGVYYLSSSDQ
ncbi:MAG: VPS10 domain-containing protein, partial [Flavobacteriales bacterium]